MRFMNEPDIDDAKQRWSGHPILGPATLTLDNLASWANENSDGWHCWPKPAQAAAKLMEMIERDGTSHFVLDDERVDVTAEEYRAALKPIKAFRTRHGADFVIVG
jgi:hypothetical protein